MTSLNNPKASSVASQGVKFRALSPQISFSETRFSFVIPGRPANAYSLDQTVASIAAMKTRENPGTNGMIPPLEHSVFPPFTGMDKIYRRLQVHPAETLALADMEARADAYELNRKSDTMLGRGLGDQYYIDLFACQQAKQPSAETRFPHHTAAFHI